MRSKFLILSIKIGNFSKKSKYAKFFYSRSFYCLQQSCVHFIKWHIEVDLILPSYIEVTIFEREKSELNRIIGPQCDTIRAIPLQLNGLEEGDSVGEMKSEEEDINNEKEAQKNTI